MVSGLSVRHKDNETLNASYTFAASTDLFDVNVVLLAFLDWLRSESVCAATITTSPFITHRHVPPPLFVCSLFGCYGRKQRSLRSRTAYVPRRANLQQETVNFSDIKLPYNLPAIGWNSQYATSLNTTMKSRLSEMSGALTITPLNRLPLLKEGDDLAKIIVSRARKLGVGIKNRDLVVIGQKAVSKAEGRVIDIGDVTPSARALKIAKRTGKSPGFVEIVLKESSKVLRADEDAFIVRTKRGATCLNAGVDKSNVEGNSRYALLPQDPDASARRLRKRIKQLTGKEVGVVICDTRSRPFRKGQVEESIGVAGLNPLVDYRGQKDLFGYTLRFKNVSIADEVASAAELVMGQGREKAPAAIIRGLARVRFQNRATSKVLVIRPEDDLFKGTL